MQGTYLCYWQQQHSRYFLLTITVSLQTTKGMAYMLCQVSMRQQFQHLF